VLALAHDEGGDRGEAGLGQRAGEERVDLLAAVLRGEEVRALEVDGIDLVLGDEGLDVDRPLRRVQLGGLEVLVAQVDPLALLDLEGLDDLVVGDRLVVLGLADLAVADTAAVRLVDVVEMERVLLDGSPCERARSRARTRPPRTRSIASSSSCTRSGPRNLVHELGRSWE
jgi:hypothetical protein